MRKLAIMLAVVFISMGLYAQTKPGLAILPFTGGNPADAETIARFFSYQADIQNNFTIIPRTSAIENTMREHQFQRAGLTDSETVARLGRQLNADFVLAGHISTLGTEKLLIIQIVHVERLQQIAGDYRKYNRIEEVVNYLPSMARRIANVSRQDTSRLPRLAVLPFNIMTSGVAESDAEVLAQILAIELVNLGKYAVFPRTSAIERVMAEHRIQRSGITDPANLKLIGIALNAQYVLSANMSPLGTNNFFSAEVIHIETGRQVLGGWEQYRAITEGLLLMPNLARKLINTTSDENMVRIEGGTFMMGSPSTEAERRDDEVQRRVSVGSFYMSRYEVSQREYESVMGTNPSSYRGENLPVEMVSWYDAIEYCNRLSQRDGLTPAYTIDKGRSDPNNQSSSDTLRWLVIWNRNVNGYRLPTEAEWEYACRAGTTTPFNLGNNITTSNANYDGHYPYNNNAKGESGRGMRPVGSFAPNAWGLYDMHGNVREWCWDWYGSYNPSDLNNPTGPATGSLRVLRGGSLHDTAAHARSARRDNAAPSSRSVRIGFRVVRP